MLEHALDLLERTTERPESDERVVPEIRGFVRGTISIAIRARYGKLRCFLADLLEPEIPIAEQLLRIAGPRDRVHGALGDCLVQPNERPGSKHDMRPV